jgi:diaminohydroxyphosphoribosylaminopyrimidine deaminase/5-amino-6-(5-phosphoribosylamino)uracil reductase
VTRDADADRCAALAAAGCDVWSLPAAGRGIDLSGLLLRLGETGLDSVLVEGGGETAAVFLEARLVDRVSFLIAPILIGGRAAVPAVGGTGIDCLADAVELADVTTTWVGRDLVYSGVVRRARA